MWTYFQKIGLNAIDAAATVASISFCIPSPIIANEHTCQTLLVKVDQAFIVTYEARHDENLEWLERTICL